MAGRAARNQSGLVILYGDKNTEAMIHLIETSKERRTIQKRFNKKNNIVPKTIYKTIDDIMVSTSVADSMKDYNQDSVPSIDISQISNEDKEVILDELRKAMLNAAEELKFEKAAKIRDEITAFEKDLGIAVS